MSHVGLLGTGRGLALILASGALAAIGQADIIYQNDFESGVGAEFSASPILLSPNGSTHFLGEFSGTGAPTGTTLSLSGLFSHEQVTLSLDLYIIHSWDGNDGGNGPDTWHLAADGVDLVNATFSNWNPQQSFSDATPLGGGPFSAKTGADAENTLGYGDFFGTNTTYRLEFTFDHTASTLDVLFEGIGLQSVSDESWGIDNIVVSAEPVPEPASLLLVGAGVGALLRRRRR